MPMLIAAFAIERDEIAARQVRALAVPLIHRRVRKNVTTWL
jgi:hypothetical protein